MRRALAALLLPIFVLAGTLAATASAHPERVPDLAAERQAIAAFQALDQRLQDIGWHLAQANAPFCSETLLASGLQLQDMASYGAPAIARAALGLERDFAVQTAAAGSPAALSGAFRTNREIARIGDIDPNLWEAEERLDWKRLKRAHDFLDAALSGGEEIALTFADGETAMLGATRICATRFELAGDGDRAVADGRRVVIGVGFGGFAMSDDLLAAAIAHELAHNLLGHRATLDEAGRSRRQIRASEREADRLMPWLLANAGFDPGAAARFFREFRPDSGKVLFFPGSHPDWKRRAASVEAELPLIERDISESGRADWAKRFDLPSARAATP